MNMATSPFLVLMWKHGVVRLRRWFQTAVEILAPLSYVVFFILISLFTMAGSDLDRSKSQLRSNESYTIHQTEPYSLDSLNAPAKVLYAPTSLLSDDLMKYVAEDLKFKRLNSMQEWSRGYMGFSTEKELYDHLEELSPDDAFLLFHNLGGESWPDVLNYTIRMKREFKTHVVTPRDDGIYQVPIEPHANFATQYEPFVRLQLAVDLAYRYLLTNTKLDKTVYFQELPMARKTDFHRLARWKLLSIMPSLSAVSLGLIFIFFINRLVAERSSGIQELIKMCNVSWCTIFSSHLCNTVISLIPFAVVGPIIMTYLVVENTSFFVLFLVYFMYFWTVITLAYACSYITNNVKYSTSIAMSLSVVSLLPAILAIRYRKAGLLLAGLLPVMPLNWAWREIQAKEIDGGITLGNMGQQFSDRSMSHPVLVSLVMMLVQSVLFSFIAWYLGKVRPGDFGIALSPDFLFRRSYWGVKPRKQVKPTDSEEEPIATDRRYFEPTPTDKKVGIRIENVTKEYAPWRGPRTVGLDRVTLDVYQGEISVLLGHNGAGKTTLINCITGMIAPTLGSVSLPLSPRRYIGYCPQHNLTFPDLTVQQHVIFFAMLRGESPTKAEKSSLELLERLQIDEKKSVLTGALSGGMKRRLQLACALAGDCRVLILDEPTSGLDVETRRDMWNLFLSLRGDRTVVLSTHFMEEADALGDRVAALQGGTLTCHATPMFLKRAIGLGYRLSITTSGPPDEAGLTSLVSQQVSEATVVWRQYNALSYNLPATAVNHFPKLFDQLEEKKQHYHIQSIGMGISTLEEVFLKLCSDVDGTRAQDEIDSAQLIEQPRRVGGFALWLRQMRVLFHRHWRYLMYKKLSFFFLQILIPLTMLLLVTVFVCKSNEDKKEDVPKLMRSEVYRHLPNGVVLRRGGGETPTLRTDVLRTETVDTDIPTMVLEASKSDPSSIKKYIGGIEVNSTAIKVWYSTLYRHTVPVLSSLLAPALSPAAHTLTYNHPLTPDYVLRQGDSGARQPLDISVLLFWVAFLVLVLLSTEINEMNLPSLERVSGARSNMYINGLPPVLYWPVPLICGLLSVTVFLLLPVIIAVHIADNTHTIDQTWFLVWWYICVCGGCATFLLFGYIVSLVATDRTASIILVVVIFVAGLVLCPLQMANTLSTSQMSVWWRMAFFIAEVGLYLLPPQTMQWALYKTVVQARKNAWCDLNKATCPALLAPPTEVNSEVCCASTSSEPFGYFPEVQKCIFIMLGQFIVLYCILMSYEYGYAKKLAAAVVSMFSKPEKQTYLDPLVHQEATYVSEVIKKDAHQIPDVLLASDLHKRYPKCFSTFSAVKGVSFSVKPGECFGLLGVNGAGKSTTFDMLTLEHYPNNGEMFANSYRADQQRTKYLRSLAYCPQFLGVDDFLTAPQVMRLVLTLRGLHSKDVKLESERWIRIVGLSKHVSKPISSYSGGCARRTAAAAALCGGGTCLLDEPTSGVDPAARRRLWTALQGHIALTHHGVVISSHSMDEMEALCTRLAILVSGRVAALGAPAQLRELHAQGHTVVFKLRPGVEGDLQKLKDVFRQRVSCTLKDEHETMLKYRINEKITNGNLFRMLEEIKNSHQIIEDYSASETTLEEVFLSFSGKRPPSPQEENW